jgi:hypothetical protein
MTAPGGTPELGRVCPGPGNVIDDSDWALRRKMNARLMQRPLLAQPDLQFRLQMECPGTLAKRMAAALLLFLLGRLDQQEIGPRAMNRICTEVSHLSLGLPLQGGTVVFKDRRPVTTAGHPRPRPCIVLRAR